MKSQAPSSSSARVVSRSPRIPQALDLPSETKPGPGPLLQVRFCVVVFQKRGVPKVRWSCHGSLSLPLCLLPRLTLLAGLPLFSFLKTRIDKCAFALKRS